MKRLEISKLMDEYTDTEFFPAGGSSANPEAVKGRVLANVKAPAPEKKGRMPRRKKVLLAAALAAVLVMLVGAGFPQTVYQLFNGSVSFTENVDGKEIRFDTKVDLMQLEDGRLYLILDDEKTDITDLISETKPYIIDTSEPDKDIVYYHILGGTPEHYGWFQWMMVPCPESFGEHACADGRMHAYNFEFINVQDGEPYPVGGAGLCDPFWGMFDDFNVDAGIRVEDFQWLRAAAEELGIPFTDRIVENMTTISE